MIQLKTARKSASGSQTASRISMAIFSTSLNFKLLTKSHLILVFPFCRKQGTAFSWLYRIVGLSSKKPSLLEKANNFSVLTLGWKMSNWTYSFVLKASWKPMAAFLYAILHIFEHREPTFPPLLCKAFLL